MLQDGVLYISQDALSAAGAIVTGDGTIDVGVLIGLAVLGIGLAAGGGSSSSESGPTNNAPTVANPIADQSLNTGEAFNLTLPANTFTDADGDTLTLSAATSSGTLASNGLSFDATTGTFSGNVTATSDVTVNVTATDPSGASATDTFVIAVNNLVLSRLRSGL